MEIKDLEKERSQCAYRYVFSVWNDYLEAKKEIEEKNIDCKDKNLSNSNKELCNNLQNKFNIADNYKSYVKKIPMMILNNGLGATFAFIYSKKQKNEAYGLIYTQVDEWLQESYINKPKNSDLIKWIINQNSQEYQAITNEVLAFLGWLKRFADGMIEGDENGA